MAEITDLSRTDLADAKSAHALFDRGDFDGALEGAEKLLLKHPDDIYLLSIAAESLMKQDRYGLAYSIYQRLTRLEPDVWAFWNNLGRCFQETARFDDAAVCFRRCIKLAPDEFAPYRNMSSIAAEQGDLDGATEWALKAVKVAKTSDDLLTVDRSMQRVHLARRDWAEGWRCFDLDLGTKYRPNKQYRGEPWWDGSPGKRVVIYGEQGLGDEILFASMYPDAMKDCTAILECDRRLEGLFRRSFPQAEKVYGTRHDRDLFWPVQNRIDARIAGGSLGRLYRGQGGFPRKPYLVADPLRRTGYRAILDTLPGRKIGIAWTGGQWNTRSAERSVTLDALRPLLGRPGLTFVSLQYREPHDIAAFEAEAGIKIHHWPFAVQTKNYDDTAALVSELDAVVSVTTAVALLAGALGKETHVLVPEHPTWHWAADGEMPWLDVKLYRKKGPSWAPVIQQIAEAL